MTTKCDQIPLKSCRTPRSSLSSSLAVSFHIQDLCYTNVALLSVAWNTVLSSASSLPQPHEQFPAVTEFEQSPEKQIVNWVSIKLIWSKMYQHPDGEWRIKRQKTCLSRIDFFSLQFIQQSFFADSSYCTFCFLCDMSKNNDAFEDRKHTVPIF